MNKLILISIIILLVPYTSAITINEIMYNPEGSDNNREYIEIYLEDPISLTNYIIQDLASEDVLEELQYRDSNYALIVEEGFNYNSIDASVYSAGATIGNNLNNDDLEIIILKDSDENIIDAITYSDNWGGDDNDKSLCKIPDKEGIWQECDPTPGLENGISESSEDFSDLEISEFLPNPLGDDNEAMPGGEFIEIFNSGESEIDLKDLKLKDAAGHTLTISDTLTLDGTIIDSNGYLTIYTNGFSGFLNNDGLEIISLLDSNKKLIKDVSYSTSEEGLSWSKVNNIWQLRLPTPNSENQLEEPETESSLKIEKIYFGSDDKAKFGDSLRVKIDAYKGNSTKQSVSAYLEKGSTEISKRTKFNLYTKFTNYTLTVPIQILPNCNQKFDDQEYYLIVEGLDTKDEEKVKVEGITTSLCETVTVASTKGSKEMTYEILETPTEISTKDNIKTKIKIYNNSTESKKVKAWTYLYNGPKCITGDREANLKEADIPAQSSLVLDLNNNIVSGTSPGEYNLKLKVLEGDKKTPTEFTQSVNVLATEKDAKQETTQNTETKINELTGNVIYENSSEKSKKIAIYFLNAILITLIVIFIKKSYNPL